MPRQSQLEGMALPPEPSRYFPWLLAGSVLAVLAVALLLGWLLGVFESEQVDEAATEGVVLIGSTLVAQAVVVASLIVNHSLEQRTYRLAVYEQLRLKAEAEELAAQKRVETRQMHDQRAVDNRRLRVETTVAALGLLSTPDGRSTSASQQAGAITALVGLGEVDLAVSLLGQRWAAEDGIGSGAAVKIVEAIVSSSEATDEQVVETIEIFANQAASLWQLDQGPYYNFPYFAYERWPTELPQRARWLILIAVLGMFYALALERRRETTRIESVFFYLSFLAFDADTDVNVKQMAAALGRLLSPVVPDLKQVPISDDFRAATEAEREWPRFASARFLEVDRWVRSVEPPTNEGHWV